MGMVVGLVLAIVAVWLLWVVVPVAFFGFIAVFLGIYQRQVWRTLLASPPVARHPPSLHPGPGQQPAYRQYFFSQGWADLEESVGTAVGRCQALTERLIAQIVKACFQGDAAWMFWPVGVVGMAGVVAGVTGGATALLLAVTIYATLVLVAHVVGWAGVCVLRLIDAVVLRLRGISIITCGSCHQRMHYPAYECPGPECTIRHSDVRPGRYGVFRRVCACGSRLPTLLVFGSHQLRAFCVHCGQPLVVETGTAPELMLPLFGATTAGKTRLMLTLVRALADLLAEEGAQFAFADPETEERFRELVPALEPGRQTRQTLAGPLPRAYSIYVAPPRGPRRLLHVFDVAGERFVGRRSTEELRYLALARLFLFVLDPLSIDPFWRSLPEPQRTRLASLRAVQPPEDLFLQTCEQMHLMGARTRESRLAVALSKHDLVGDLAPFAECRGDSAAIERCLARELQLGNLVRTMQREFREVCFFPTAALVSGRGTADPSVVAVGRWVLWRTA